MIMICPFPKAFGNSENRRFQRVKLDLSGRYMLASRSEYACRTLNISPGGMLVAGPVKPEIGETVVIYLDALGRFVGQAVRITVEGFAVTLSLSRNKRETLADRLTWFANRSGVGLQDNRRYERFVPLMRRAILRLPNEREHIVKIRDISVSGVAVETGHLPKLGAPIIIGNTPVVVVRHFEGGFAGEFVAPFADGEIDELTRL